HIQSVDDRVLPYFPEYPDLANVGPEKESLTIEHLLTMTAGFDWNELSRPYDDPLNDYQKYLASNDRVRYVLERPTIQQPGTRVSYNTALSQVLSVILTKAVGMSAAQYAEVKLFGPLGIENWEWSPYDDKTSVGGAGLYLRAVDMAKLGQLYLQNGVWEGRQIVSTDWVQASTASYGTVTQWHDYGYQWWRYSSAAANSYLDGHEGIYYALGRGGQYVWVLPYANAVLSCTAWNDNNGYWPEAMLWEHVGPSIRR
ncbi:MAG: serine hydrolase, partial [bacterium]|nr:serine hydrolase [bacterium]